MILPSISTVCADRYSISVGRILDCDRLREGSKVRSNVTGEDRTQGLLKSKNRFDPCAQLDDPN